jgi:predicted nucleic acid-binding protein
METTGVGIIVDPSVIVAAEGRGHTVLQMLERIQATQGEVEIAISVVTVAEMVHGTYRADTPERQERRLAFIDRLCSDVPVYPVTLAIAYLAGRIRAQQQPKGIEIPFADLLIGTTALHLDYAVATRNERHFHLIPGLALV